MGGGGEAGADAAGGGRGPGPGPDGRRQRQEQLRRYSEGTQGSEECCNLTNKDINQNTQ